MTERKVTPEGQLVRIAHMLKAEQLRLGTLKYHRFVDRRKWTYLDGQTIAQSLKKGQRKEVLRELADYANDSFT